MQMTEIRKVYLGVAEQESEILVSLAASVKEVLGYDVLSKSTAVQKELTQLQAVLKELDIPVFNVSDVTKYQKERMVERSVELFKEWLKEMQSRDEIHSYDRFGGPAWNEQKISEYKQPVPEFVLAKAVQIKQAIPECEIFIEGLEDHPDPSLVVAIPDGRPYYKAKERYYVEVWAEPKFEGTLRTKQDTDEMPF
jgi:hypothetical protein